MFNRNDTKKIQAVVAVLPICHFFPAVTSQNVCCAVSPLFWSFTGFLNFFLTLLTYPIIKTVADWLEKQIQGELMFEHL